MKIDVIIPVYKPGKELFELIDRLEKQTVPVNRIILMNTEEKYLEQLVYGSAFFEHHERVEVHHLSKREFDHGGTRRKGVDRSEAEVFVMMTQDAMPADSYLLERLTAPLYGKRADARQEASEKKTAVQVACAYARQLPNESCRELERYTRAFNYPDSSGIKTQADLPKLGIKTYFCSNVCAAYRRDIYEQLGGFVHRTIFNEDMIYAGTAVQAGYAVAYVAEAQVIHSHNYTNRQQFHRNFDLGVSQAQHPEIFAGVPSESEGKKMVMQTARHLCKQGKPQQLVTLFAQSVAKYAGYLLGKHYAALPHSLVLAFSDNKGYWK